MTYHYKSGYFKLLLIAVSLFFLSDPLSATAGVKKPDPPKNAGEKKIHVTADRMIAEGNSNNAEFIGNVKVSQDKTVITADRIRVSYYNRDAGSKERPKGEDSIKEITATGNVRIWFDDKIAESSQAVYTAETRILVLTGPVSKIISGNNSISGSKITFSRNDGRINVEGGGSNRVEAFFESDGKSL